MLIQLIKSFYIDVDTINQELIQDVDTIDQEFFIWIWHKFKWPGELKIRYHKNI